MFSAMSFVFLYEDFIACYSHDGYGDFFAKKKDCNYEYSAKNFLHGTKFKSSGLHNITRQSLPLTAL